MMRKEKYRNAVEHIVRECGDRHDIKFVELTVMPDHVHALVSCRPDMSQSRALKLLKGGSARAIFEKYPRMKLRYPKGHFWSRGKTGRTVGDVDKETVADYVRRQAEQTLITTFI